MFPRGDLQEKVKTENCEIPSVGEMISFAAKIMISTISDTASLTFSVTAGTPVLLSTDQEAPKLDEMLSSCKLEGRAEARVNNGSRSLHSSLACKPLTGQNLKMMSTGEAATGGRKNSSILPEMYPTGSYAVATGRILPSTASTDIEMVTCETPSDGIVSPASLLKVMFTSDLAGMRSTTVILNADSPKTHWAEMYDLMAPRRKPVTSTAEAPELELAFRENPGIASRIVSPGRNALESENEIRSSVTAFATGGTKSILGLDMKAPTGCTLVMETKSELPCTPVTLILILLSPRVTPSCGRTT
mmetsp:Transcript_2163/g.4981  ORF Transcript_2163/g.4981 Transcript_2163/m.4981 type:complete len:303 (+) Transcript_2163:1452-2360(+)